MILCTIWPSHCSTSMTHASDPLSTINSSSTIIGIVCTLPLISGLWMKQLEVQTFFVSQCFIILFSCEILRRLKWFVKCFLIHELQKSSSHHIGPGFLLNLENFRDIFVIKLFVVDMTEIFVKHSASRKGRLKAILSYLQLFHVQLMPAQPPPCFSWCEAELRFFPGAPISTSRCLATTHLILVKF